MRVGLLALALTGCGFVRLSFESDRRINDHNIQYSREIQQVSTQPEVVEKAREIEENSVTLQEGTVGAPSEPTPATPENSAKERKTSQRRHQVVAGGLGLAQAAIPWLWGTAGASILGILAKAAMQYRGTLMAVMEGVDAAKKNLGDEDQKKVNEAMGRVAARKNVGPMVDDMLTKVRAKSKMG